MWKDNKLDGNIIVIEDSNLKKQLWHDGRAIKNLPNDTFIYFETFAKKYVKKQKNKN